MAALQALFNLVWTLLRMLSPACLPVPPGPGVNPELQTSNRVCVQIPFYDTDYECDPVSSKYGVDMVLVSAFPGLFHPLWSVMNPIRWPCTVGWWHPVAVVCS